MHLSPPSVNMNVPGFERAELGATDENEGEARSQAHWKRYLSTATRQRSATCASVTLTNRHGRATQANAVTIAPGCDFTDGLPYTNHHNALRAFLVALSASYFR